MGQHFFGANRLGDLHGKVPTGKNLDLGVNDSVGRLGACARVVRIVNLIDRASFQDVADEEFCI